jgi:hypothetical protein
MIFAEISAAVQVISLEFFRQMTMPTTDRKRYGSLQLSAAMVAVIAKW